MELSLWKNRSFLSLLSAQVTANIGDQFYAIALLWYLLQQTNSPSTLSLISVPEMVAGFLFYLIGGVLADRYSPKRLMISSAILRVILVCVVGFMVMSGVKLVALFLCAQFFIGICTTMFNPARTVALKAIVPMEQLSQANAYLDTTFRTIRILAPMTIGVLANVLPISSLFFINAGSYLLSVWSIYRIRKNLVTEPDGASVSVPFSQYLADIKSAMNEVIRSRGLLYIILFANMGFLVWQICWTVGFPLLANQIGNGDAGMLGILVGSYGVGNLIGSLFMARFHYQSHLLVILVGWFFSAVGFTLLGIGQSFSPLVYVAAAIAGIGGPLIGIPNLTAIQVKVEPANTGKVFALNMLFFTAFCVSSSTLGAIWLGKLPIMQLFVFSGLYLCMMVGVGIILHKRVRRKETTDRLSA